MEPPVDRFSCGSVRVGLLTQSFGIKAGAPKSTFVYTCYITTAWMTSIEWCFSRSRGGSETSLAVEAVHKIKSHDHVISTRTSLVQSFPESAEKLTGLLPFCFQNKTSCSEARFCEAIAVADLVELVPQHDVRSRKGANRPGRPHMAHTTPAQ